MSKNVQLIILHIAVAVLCFIGALVFFNNRMGMEKGSAVAELANPSYPVLEIGNDTSSYNLMAGYKEDIDLSLVRNQITLTNNKNAVILKLHDYDYDITAIQYTLFEKTPDKPTETGTLNQLTKNKKKNIKLGTLTFKNTLSENKVYYLKMAVRLNDSTRIYFYTKVQSGSGYHLDDYLAFVLKFHNNLFDKATMDENASYLETSADMIDDNLESVSINSGREAVSFGNMEVKQETKPRITLQEMNNTYTVIRVNTILSTEISDGVIQYYDLSETYKLRYTADRMYLLDYERTMDAYYNESIIDSANNLISLGIQNEKNISYIYSDKGYRVCFAVEGQLWYYDYQSSDMYKIYSLASENISDIRNATGNHGIKLLSMDDKGNIFYLVYGYINRGRHEGMNGIQVMKYDAKTNCNEEISFLSTSLPYDSMKEDLEKFSYLNSKSVFYCILEGDLHEIDLEKKKDKILESGLVNESLTASKDQSIIAIEKEQNLYKNKQIDNVEISNEGRRALREKLREVKPKVEEPIGYELTIQDTNEVEWEHYTSMREYSGLTLKDGKYNLEDVMKSMMDAYETRYNYVVKEHENGERQVSYDLTGENSLTLDEDLAGLDRAYNKRLANLAGYIVCQQTNDGSKFFQTTNVKKNTAEQKEYIDTAVSMMEKAQKRFLEMREEPKYTAGIAKSVIWDIMSSDKNFMETTQRLFAKTIYHNT